MKVLSLCQPYASLLILGFKRWETRSWKPGPRNMNIIEKEGLLIHASLSRRYADLMGTAPFSDHLQDLGKMPYGAILGHIRLGRIISTEEWLSERSEPYDPDEPLKDEFWEEYMFGDYREGRWAWEIAQGRCFAEPIPFKGSLSLWNYPYQPKPAANELSLHR